MYATIMVPAAGDGTDEAALNMALVLGRTFGAHIDFVRARHAAGAGMHSVAGALPAGNLGDAYVRMVNETDERLGEAAHKAFDAVCARHALNITSDPEARGALTIASRECGGTADLISQARYSDLVVTAGGPPGIAGDLLIGCGRPVVLAPAKAPEGVTRAVAVAWKETAEAARAVTAAIPLLKTAERVVVIVANETEGGAARTAQSATRLTQHLAWHGIRAETLTILSQARSAPEAVLNMAGEAGADILVMGGYGHSRTREFVFGGFTRHVLNNETLPVFLVH
jgi:nucleotide-binding universal stress UspA family protein